MLEGFIDQALSENDRYFMRNLSEFWTLSLFQLLTVHGYFNDIEILETLMCPEDIKILLKNPYNIKDILDCWNNWLKNRSL